MRLLIFYILSVSFLFSDPQKKPLGNDFFSPRAAAGVILPGHSVIHVKEMLGEASFEIEGNLYYFFEPLPRDEKFRNGGITRVSVEKTKVVKVDIFEMQMVHSGEYIKNLIENPPR